MPENRTRAVAGQGIDEATVVRPGIPREHAPRPAPGAHWETPEPQMAGRDALERVGIHRPTTVFGTGQPPKLLSGFLRRLAYGVPEHRARHWLLLFAADRADVIEHRLARGWPWMVALAAAGLSYRVVMRSLRRRVS